MNAGKVEHAKRQGAGGKRNAKPLAGEEKLFLESRPRFFIKVAIDVACEHCQSPSNRSFFVAIGLARY